MDGNTLVIGLRGEDTLGTDAGAVAVVEYTGFGWTQVATLTDPTGLSFDEFGASVAIDGDTIVVGSPYDFDAVGIERGSASVFQRTNGVWQHVTKLVGSASDRGDTFGNAVAVDGSTIAVGSPSGNGPSGFLDSGAVTVFEFDGSDWIEVATLAASDAQSGDMLGTSVALSGNLLLCGAPFDSDAGFEAGVVVPFRRDGGQWLESISFTAPSPGAERYFGSSIDIDGDEVIVGEPFYISGGDVIGRAHTFFDDGVVFSHIESLQDPNANGSALLGSSVSLEGGEAIVGAFLDPSNGFAGGTVLRFIVDGDDCDGNGVPDACQIAEGNGTDCNANGVLDSCDLLEGASDCDGNGLLDACDIAAGAEDCDGNGELDSCEVLVSDCNGNGQLDACEPDCNDNGVPDDCDIDSGTVPDCNANGNPDDCDIFFGISSDCDGNFVPDECDLANGDATDCNMNGLSDACDILVGTSADADGDGFPDECGPRFVRGDVNADLALDLADAIVLLLYITGSGTEPGCLAASDANGDGQVNIADGIFLATYVTGSGTPPPPPFPDCDFEPPPVSGLSCDLRPMCP